VHHFFQNGGRDALVVRVHHQAVAATVALPGGLTLVAASEGAWGSRLRVRVDHDTRPFAPGEAPDSLFNLTIADGDTGVVERFDNLSIDPAHPDSVARVLERDSSLVRVASSGAPMPARPPAHAAPPPGVDALADPASSTPFDSDGADGVAITDAQLSDAVLEPARQGLWALEHADLFNLLCLPPLAPDTDVAPATWTTAIAYARRRRAMVIVDAPAAWVTPDDARAGVATFLPRDANAALYFPRVRMPDALDGGRARPFASCGVVAGVVARIDAERGVWKAPAGLDAAMAGVSGLTVALTESEHAELNRLAVNGLRAFGHGPVVWGSRTLAGADGLAVEWRYVPVRRMALFIEESLVRGTRWTVFEPNGPPLWSRLGQSVERFMHGLFVQGAFQGAVPRQAYYVKCGADTTTRDDLEAGVVDVEVGFAPLKPAEFVVLTIRQRAQPSEP